ncbi:MAG: hypothetical protein ABFD89_16850 [Bryobacteraceae bacterium]
MGKTTTNDQLKHWQKTCHHLADLLQNIDRKAGQLQTERKGILLRVGDGDEAAQSKLAQIGQKLAELATERQNVDDALTEALHGHDGAQAALELEDRKTRAARVRETAKQIAEFGQEADQTMKHLAELLTQRRQAVQDLATMLGRANARTNRLVICPNPALQRAAQAHGLDTFLGFGRYPGDPAHIRPLAEQDASLLRNYFDMQEVPSDDQLE